LSDDPLDGRIDTVDPSATSAALQECSAALA